MVDLSVRTAALDAVATHDVPHHRHGRVRVGSRLYSSSMTITCTWRGPFGDAELNALHAEGFDHEPLADGWWARVNRHSLGWVCARAGDELIGFVNVAWDGGTDAFLLDTLVAPGHQRQGIGVAGADNPIRAGQAA
jgi:hypothetical protein